MAADPGMLVAMSSDDVVQALSAALAADPGNAGVRRVLAANLAAIGRYAEALEHTTVLMASQPDDPEAIGIAERASRALGDTARADGFARLLAALSGPTPPAAPTAPSTPASDTPTILPPAPTFPPLPGAPTGATPGGGPDGQQGPPPVPSMGDGVPDTIDDLLSQWGDSPAAPEPEVGELTTPTLTLSQVGGLADVKARLDRSLFAPLRNPELAAAYGASVRGGLVLYGPPGCGKTYVARAVAGELGARFYSVGLNDVLDMWLGNSERNVHSIFEVARAHAPCVLFLDEIDALGMRRTNLRTSPSMRNVVNQLLTELDGVSSSNEGVFLLAATNHPWDIDPALLRPGRLGHLVLVTPPDYEARAHILWSNLVDRPHNDLDVWAVARRTEGMSGADLREICERAVETAMSESLAKGVVVPIDTQAVLAAMVTVRPSIGTWIDTARNVATFSNLDGQYDDLAAWLKSR